MLVSFSLDDSLLPDLLLAVQLRSRCFGVGSAVYGHCEEIRKIVTKARVDSAETERVEKENAVMASGKTAGADSVRWKEY
jgi:hypothetical protein